MTTGLRDLTLGAPAGSGRPDELASLTNRQGHP